MASRRQVAVLGLGRFGQAVALELARLGHDVLAVDNDPRAVQDVSDDVTHAAQAASLLSTAQINLPSNCSGDTHDSGDMKDKTGKPVRS